MRARQQSKMATSDTKTRVRSGGEFCAAPNCSSARYKAECDGWSFFRFPLDQARCDVWKQNCRRKDLMNKTAKQLHAACVLCKNHFEDNQFYRPALKDRLLPNAVPTMFDVTNPPPRLKSSRKSPKKRFCTPAQDTENCQTNSLVEAQTDADHQDAAIPCSSEQEPSAVATGHLSSVTNGERISTLTKRVKRLRSRLHRMEKKLRQCKCSKKTLKEKASMTALMKKVKKILPPAAAALVNSQLRVADKTKKGRKWTGGDKSLALTLYHASPKAYKLLGKVLTLPSVKTLKRVLQNVNIQPGFNDNILHALSLKVKALPPLAQFCALVFDEMAIKEEVIYDQQHDRVEGLEDYGGMRTAFVANHATVFMVRGLAANWKQPVGYFLSSGPMRSDKLHTIFLECIDKVSQAGLKVKIVIADQGSNNRSMFSMLHVNEDKPFFVHNDQKIHVMHDPPHLLKNIRNNLKKSGFQINGDNVCWQHIENLFRTDRANAIRLAPKLTERHISLPPFSSLRVRYATQVLSHSVAAAISTLVRVGLLPRDALPTATFVDQFDQLFNCFNSRNLNAKQPMAHGLSDQSGHVSFLQEMLLWLNTIAVVGQHQKLPCLVGWKMAIKALLSLWEDLKANGFSFLLTNRLNQDCLENFFSRIRCCTGHVANPSASQLRAIMRQLMVDQIFSHSDHSNCEDDAGKFLLNLKAVRQVVQVNPPVNEEEEKLRLIATPLPPPKEPRLQAAHDNVITYIAGYVSHKIKLQLCTSCQGLVEGAAKDAPSHILLNTKQYQHCQGLKTPSSLLVDCIKKMEDVYSMNIQRTMYIDNVKANLCDMLQKEIQDDIVCPLATCQVQRLVVEKFVNTRLHFTLRECTQNFSQKCLRKNRKLMNLSHV